MDHEPIKKKTIINPITICRFFVIFNQFKKDHETQMGFLEDVMLFVIKGFWPTKIMEFIWLWKVVYIIMPNSDVLGFASFFGKVLPTLVEKKGNICVANIGFMFINHLHF
jgi:hypothetical protein